MQQARGIKRLSQKWQAGHGEELEDTVVELSAEMQFAIRGWRRANDEGRHTNWHEFKVGEAFCAAFDEDAQSDEI